VKEIIKITSMDQLKITIGYKCEPPVPLYQYRLVSNAKSRVVLKGLKDPSHGYLYRGLVPILVWWRGMACHLPLAVLQSPLLALLPSLIRWRPTNRLAGEHVAAKQLLYAVYRETDI
jgi:hypothetical protein